MIARRAKGKHVQRDEIAAGFRACAADESNKLTTRQLAHFFAEYIKGEVGPGQLHDFSQIMQEACLTFCQDEKTAQLRECYLQADGLLPDNRSLLSVVLRNEAFRTLVSLVKSVVGLELEASVVPEIDRLFNADLHFIRQRTIRVLCPIGSLLVEGWQAQCGDTTLSVEANQRLKLGGWRGEAVFDGGSLRLQSTTTDVDGIIAMLQDVERHPLKALEEPVGTSKIALLH